MSPAIAGSGVKRGLGMKRRSTAIGSMYPRYLNEKSPSRTSFEPTLSLEPFGTVAPWARILPHPCKQRHRKAGDSRLARPARTRLTLAAAERRGRPGTDHPVSGAPESSWPAVTAGPAAVAEAGAAAQPVAAGAAAAGRPRPAAGGRCRRLLDGHDGPRRHRHPPAGSPRAPRRLASAPTLITWRATSSPRSFRT